MEMTVNVELNLKTAEVLEAVKKAARLAMRDTVVDVWNESIRNAPYRKTPPVVSTGHNARSLAGEVSGMGIVAKGQDAQPEKSVDDSKMEGAVYSTSGYGGYLEVGTWKMPARPYMKPALDKNFSAVKFADKTRSYLGNR